MIKRIRYLRVQLVLILRLQRGVDLVQRLGVLLVADIQEVSSGKDDLAVHLALEGEVETVVTRLLLVCIVPEQRLAAAPEIAAVSLAENRQQRVAVGRIRIVNRLLRHALGRAQRILIARHSEERRFQESDRFVSGY